MYAGNLVEKANVRQVLDHPLHPYTMALLTGTSEPDARNAETFKELPPGEPPSLVNSTHWLSFPSSLFKSDERLVRGKRTSGF